MFVKLAKFHVLALVLSAIVGVATLAPQLISINSLGGEFQEIYPINGSDDLYYQARVKESAEGYPTIANPYLYEHKEGVAAPFWVPDYAIATLANTVFDGDINKAFLFLDFVATALLTLLTYSIVFLIAKRRYVSLLSAAFLHLGLFLGLFGRSPSPQLNFIFFLSLFLIILMSLRSRRKIWPILSGLNLGLLFYIYPYYWTFYYVFFGLIIMLLLSLRDWAGVKRWVGSLILATLVGLPSILHTIRVSSLPEYTDTIRRLGMLNTHFPSGINILAVSLGSIFLFVVVSWHHRSKPNKFELVLLMGPLASMIVVNQHVITGKNLEFSSHYWQPAVFIAAFLIAYVWEKFMVPITNKSYKMLFIGVGGALIISGTGHYGAASYERQIIFEDREVAWQEYRPVFDWLNENTDKESVVLADNDISALIPIYTHNNVLYTDRANLHFITDQEVYDRFLIANYWKDIDEDYLINHERDLWRTQFINRTAKEMTKSKLLSLFGIDIELPERYSKAKFGEVMDRHRELKKSGYPDALGLYRVDYIVEKSENSLGIEQIDQFDEIAQLGQYKVYAIK